MTTSLDPATLEALVLNEVRRAASTSAELSTRPGIPKESVSRAIRDLADARLIQDSGRYLHGMVWQAADVNSTVLESSTRNHAERDARSADFGADTERA